MLLRWLDCGGKSETIRSYGAQRQPGEAYMVSGDKEKAIENYQKALAIDPTMESAKQALKQFTGQ